MGRMLDGAEDAIAVVLSKLDTLGYTIEWLSDEGVYLVSPRSGAYTQAIVGEYYNSLSDIWEEIKYA
tara:strand:+ start:1002 stop:1202 length:201 start_codon:yes stop_codon:yes gene_type:complete